MMKTIKHKFLALIIFSFFVLLSMPVSTYAASSISAQFEQMPMFLEGDFVPGESVDRFAKVTNNSEDRQEILLRAFNIFGCSPGPSCVSDKLHLTVSRNGNNLFSGNLTQFYGAGFIPLGEMASREQDREYVFSIFFDSGASNFYQNQVTGFNMELRFEGEDDGDTDEPPPDDGGDNGGGDDDDTPPGDGGGDDGDGDDDDGNGTPSDNGGGGGVGGHNNLAPPSLGSGGILDTTSLVITDIKVDSFDFVNKTAVVRWRTNLQSTSRVVYGRTSDGPFSINITEPNFGYPLDTDMQTVLVTEHAVTLKNLEIAERYSFRVSSRLSQSGLPTTSLEQEFVFGTSAVAVAPENPPQNGRGGTPSYGGGGIGEGGEEPPVQFEDGGGEEEDSASNFFRNLAAAIFGFPDSWAEFFVCFTLFLLILLVAYLLWSYWFSKYTSEKYPDKKAYVRGGLFFILWLVVSLILAFIFMQFCLILPILLAMLITVIYMIVRRLEKEDENKENHEENSFERGWRKDDEV
ncbi:MAG: fibronectin type III domain-containing protein [bacterium]|nr:fibronectin type III domain-containing protein [bacterium]